MEEKTNAPLLAGGQGFPRPACARSASLVGGWGQSPDARGARAVRAFTSEARHGAVSY